MKRTFRIPLLVLGAFLVAAACSSPTPPADEPDGGEPIDTGPSTVKLAGVASGMVGTMTVENNGSESLVIKTNGPFVFEEAFETGATYDVQVTWQPEAQFCEVKNGKGTFVGNVANVTVTCSNTEYVVGGTVTGLVGKGLSLRLNGASPLSVVSNGPFRFTPAIPLEDSYAVTVGAQPIDPAQACGVAGADGGYLGSDVTSIVVACSTGLVAEAGEYPGFYAPEDTVHLDATGSHNLADGGLFYSWAETSDVGVVFNKSSSGSPDDVTFSLDYDFPNASEAVVEVILELTVSDQGGAPAKDTATIFFYRPDFIYAVSGADGGGTSPADPIGSLREAVFAAVDGGRPVVAAAAGTYLVATDVGTQVSLRDGVTLLGGFDEATWLRGTVGMESRIWERSDGGGSAAAPTRAVEAYGVGSSAVIDGFTVHGGDGGFTAGVYLMGGGVTTPVIRGNIIVGGAGVTRSEGISLGRGVPADGGVGAPLIEGNSVRGGMGAESVGLYVFGLESDPEVRHNDIHGGSSLTGSRGVEVERGRGVYHGNTIHGGSGSGPWGVSVKGADAAPIFFNDLIHGGGGNSPRGLNVGKIGAGELLFFNNTVFAGEGISANAAWFDGDNTACELWNNIFQGPGGSFSYGIFESAQSGQPAVVRNNDFFGFAVAYRDMDMGCPGGNPDYYFCTVSEMEALSDGMIASGNVSLDPKLVSLDGGNWHLSQESPVNVVEGGVRIDPFGGNLLDGGYLYDFDDLPRSDLILGGPGNTDAEGFSMGAYELDLD